MVGLPPAAAVLVPEHADRRLAHRAPAPAEHPDVPHLVTDLADPRSVLGPLGPAVGERGFEQEGRIDVPGLAHAFTGPPPRRTLWP